MKVTRSTTSSIGGEDAKGTPAAGSGEKTTRIFWGRALCVFGLISALLGAFSVDVSLEVVGILLGTSGYALGAYRLGRVTIVLSVVAMFFALAVYQGYVSVPWPMNPEI